jgi:5-methylcytosine-specific restriction endonuclease McrA
VRRGAHARGRPRFRFLRVDTFGPPVGRALDRVSDARNRPSGDDDARDGSQSGRLPATRDAFVAGRLSEVQATEITAAAATDPDAESTLLAAAEEDTFAELKQQCRQVRASAAGDEDAVERIRLGRYLRNWIDRDGAVRLDARLAPDDGAKFLATVQAGASRLQKEAKWSGQRERAEAYAADALVALATGRSVPKAVVHVDVDAAAFARGRTQPGETCRIRGVGPIPVGVAQRLASEGIVKVIERDGVDVRRVAHLGRTIPEHLRTALEARDPACVVPRCDRRTDLEIDHVVPFAQGGETRLDNLARLCGFHHAQKSYHGWRLTGPRGAWRWKRGSPRQRAP